MSEVLTEITFEGNENINELQLRDNSADRATLGNSNLSGATKVGVVFPDIDVSFNSTDDATIVQFTIGGKVTLKLGESALPVGLHNAYLVVYDAARPNGIRWTPSLLVRKFQ